MNYSILVIVDDKKVADTITKGLVENDYLVDVCYDWSDGWQRFQQKNFNLVILGSSLGEMNEMCSRIKTTNSTVLIVLLSALDVDTGKIVGYDAEVDAVVLKPFKFQELLDTVKTLTSIESKKVTPENEILKAGELIMDMKTKEVTRQGLRVTLTMKEFKLLGLLLRNKNQVVSIADIALKIWGADFQTGSSVIDVYVKYLQNKIGRQFIRKMNTEEDRPGYGLYVD